MRALNILRNVARISGFFHLMIADMAHLLENVSHKIKLTKPVLIVKDNQSCQAYFLSLKIPT